VRAVLKQMALRDVQILILRNSGLSYKEIAAACDVAPAAVGSLLMRAEAKFETLYQKAFGGSASDAPPADKFDERGDHAPKR
jgi:RNA polymerase sigma-70 factor, ECF subfamily